MPESKVFPSSLVTVCGAPVEFVHTTTVPTGTVRVAGLNANEPFTVAIITVCFGPVATVVGAAVAVLPLPFPYFPPPVPYAPPPLVVVGVFTTVVVEGDAVEVLFEPQAVKKSNRPRTERLSQNVCLYRE